MTGIKQNNKRLDNICKDIKKDILEKEYLEESCICRLAEGLAYYNGTEPIMPKAYIDLLDVLGKMLTYSEFEDLSPEQAFLIGSIWGCLQSMEWKRRYIRSKESKTKQKELLIKKYENQRKILKIIKKNPGIREKDLFQDSFQEEKETLQFQLRNMTRDKIVNCQYIGNETYYFLSELGRQLLSSYPKKV